MKKRKTHKYRGMECDSMSEVFTLYWLWELADSGYIKEIKRGDTYPLFAPVTRGYIVRLKTKANSEMEVLLAPHVYTPDFKFKLTEKGWKLPLFQEIDSTSKLRKWRSFNLIHQKGECVIETKGSAFRYEGDTTEKFKVDQKWTWEKHKVYVNLFQHDRVFPLTFTPDAYLVTDVRKEKRKINWKVRNLKQYLKS